MITVHLNRADFEYDIHSLVKAFYPAEEVSVSAEAKKAAEPVLFHIEVTYQRKNSESAEDASRKQTGSIRFVFTKGEARTDLGEAGTEEATPQNPCLEGELAGDVSVDFADRKETKNRLKQKLYRMLEQYSGRSLPWGTLTGIRPVKIPMKLLEEGKDQKTIYTYMKDKYFASDEKIQLAYDVAVRERSILQKLDYKNGYSLYIGIPFCPTTCLYCSFTSYPLSKWGPRVDEYLDALGREIDYTARAVTDKHLDTIYIGGGTPTTLTPEQMDRLFCKIEDSLDLSHLKEFSVEGGRPDSITEDKLKVMKKHNVTRISINPQTMQQKTLDLIGRRHTVEQTKKSFLLARELGFDDINMDLIVGLPEERLKDVQNTMEEIKKLGPDNLTVHSLAVKRAARLRMQREHYRGLHMVNTWETIHLTADYAARMGLHPYYLYRQKNMAGNFENVGYAREGCEGLYNILIMEEKQTIMALGAGASTKFVLPPADGTDTPRIERVENVKDITNYLTRVDEMIERKRTKMEELGWH